MSEPSKAARQRAHALAGRCYIATAGVHSPSCDAIAAVIEEHAAEPDLRALEDGASDARGGDAADAGTQDAGVPDATGAVDAAGPECILPAGWLLAVSICPSAPGCGNCRISDPNDRDAGIGTPISGCVHSFTGAAPVFCVSACEECP